MSVEVVYRVGDELLTIKFGRGEAQAVSRLSAQFPAEDRALFGTQELGEPESISAQELMAAAERVLAALNSGAVDLGGVYSFERTDSQGRRLSTSTGLQTRIGGIDYWFDSGRDQCTMQPVYRDAEMRVIAKGEVTDLRARTSVQTDNGELRIRRSPASKSLTAAILKVLNFAANHRGAMVQKVVM